MQNRKIKLILSSIAMSILLTGCSINSMSKEDIQQYINNEIQNNNNYINDEISKQIANATQDFITKTQVLEIQESIEKQINTSTSFSDLQKDEIKKIVEETISGNEATVAQADESTTTETKATSKTTTDSSDSADSVKLSKAQKEEIDKRVAAQMATIIKETGIVVDDGNTGGGSVSEGEKETILTNIQTLFNGYNSVVKDLETMNKQVGDNKGRIDILCSQVSSNNTATISDSDKARLKSEIKKEVLTYVLQYLISINK